LTDRYGLYDLITEYIGRENEMNQYLDLDAMDLEADRERVYDSLKETILRNELKFGERVLEAGFDAFQEDDEETLLYQNVKKRIGFETKKPTITK
jgi:hypothetical protein